MPFEWSFHHAPRFPFLVGLTILALGLGFPSSDAAGTNGCGLDAEGTTVPQIRLFGLPDDRVVDEFQHRRLGVARLWELPESPNGPWEIGVDYPSFNAGGEAGGSTVLYSHRITVFAGEDAGSLAALDRRVSLILEARDGEATSYDWVGCALGGEGENLDWFADKPELLFQGAKASD